MQKELKIHAGIDSLKIKKLNGYENENYLVKTAKTTLIAKTYSYSRKNMQASLAETDLLLFLQKNNHKTPRPIHFLDGSYVKKVQIDGEEKVLRLLSFLEGDFLGDITPKKTFYIDLGVFLANINKSLINIENTSLLYKKHEWDLQYLNLNKKYISDIKSPQKRRLVKYFFNKINEKLSLAKETLRKSVIHGDANEWNVLVAENNVCGLIDFGDSSYSYLINEVSTAMVYSCYDKDNGIQNALLVLKGYHSVFPILENEIPYLYYLMAAKMCISVCKAANSRKIDPQNSYALSSEINAWKMLEILLCKSPLKVENQFRKELGYPQVTPPLVGSIVKKRKRFMGLNLSLSYKRPIYMSSSAFQYMFDVYGNTFLDAYNNIPHVGHCHPEVVNAGIKQMTNLNTNTRYLYDNLTEYADKLLSKFPDSLSKVYFVNSGSAASDLAIRMARAHTKKENLLVIENGYHGNTQLGIDISDYKFNNKKGQGQKKDIFKVDMPDSYRGKYSEYGSDSGKKYAKDVINKINKIKGGLAAFIAEPIIGCGGQVVLPKDYLKIIYPEIRRQGGVCISDEVQTGFGRLGKWFWGFEMHEVCPDIVILGKPMGNGHPIGAVICTEEISASFSKGVEFFSSFGGNPVSCAIGLAVLDVIEKENLQKNAREVGEYYKERLNYLKSKFECIGDVRGEGLFLGVEIIGTKKSPNRSLAQEIKNSLRDKNILLSTDGPFDNVIKTKPPLVFNKENVDRVVLSLERFLSQRTIK